MIKKLSFSAWFLLLPFCFIYAQTASIRGFVYEKKTGEPVIFTNVYLLKTSYGSQTDVNGYYAITQVPKGEYTLMVTAIGYDSLKIPITLGSGDVITKKLYLETTTYVLKGAQIVASSAKEKAKESTTSVEKITPRQIKQLPTIGGQPDLAQYLQVLPGVIFTGDQGGQLYIRGGSPVQNKVMLDGMVVYNPFHSIGLFSVFDTDILRNADVYTGGFGADYGGRISSVMDVTTRDGNKKRVAGKLSASVFGAKVLVEGPLQKQKEGGNSSSYILSVKNSYLSQSSKTFYKYVDKNGLPFDYTDIYGKVSFNSASGSKVNFFGFNFNDQVNYKSISDFNWVSSGGGSNFIIIPGKSPALIQGTFAYSTYKMTLEEANTDPRTSTINGFNAGLNFSYFFNKNTLKYGFEMQGFKTIFDFYNSVGRKIDQSQNTTEIAGYVKYKIINGKLVIDPGLRFQWYASLSNFSFEPRLSLKYNISEKFRFKFSGGLYSQNLIAASTDRDVVNLFYGFLSGPEELPEKFDGKSVNHKLQKSQHLVAGFEYDPNNYISLNIEAYYKNFPQLTNLNRYKIFDDTPEYSKVPDYLKKDYIIETGDAKGVDFTFKYDNKRFYFWAVYSYAFVNRYDGVTHYVPHYDRRHNVNLVGSYFLGEDNQWEFDLRWNFGSGFPFTPTNGYYGKITFNDGINTNLTTINEQLGILYGKLNTKRLPTYHRLDMNIKRKFQLREETFLELDFSVTNLYDRKNIFYVTRVTGEKVYQLPILPSFGATLTF